MALSTAAAADAGQTHLRIHLLDYAGLPESALNATASRAGEILRKAGIDTEWNICQTGPMRGMCDLERSRESLIVRVVPGMGPAAVFGRAVKAGNGGASGVYATLYFGRIREAAQRFDAPPSLLLACALAHETGELLGLSHSGAGVMHAAFDKHDVELAAVGRLNFGERERENLQLAILTRNGRLTAMLGNSRVLK
jgi:hypothetical protein